MSLSDNLRRLAEKYDKYHDPKYELDHILLRFDDGTPLHEIRLAESELELALAFPHARPNADSRPTFRINYNEEGPPCAHIFYGETNDRKHAHKAFEKFCTLAGSAERLLVAAGRLPAEEGAGSLPSGLAEEGTGSLPSGLVEKYRANQRAGRLMRFLYDLAWEDRSDSRLLSRLPKVISHRRRKSLENKAFSEKSLSLIVS
jgi:hypothetical protein